MRDEGNPTSLIYKKKTYLSLSFFKASVVCVCVCVCEREREREREKDERRETTTDSCIDFFS